MKNNQNNPMLCDVETGVCEMPNDPGGFEDNVFTTAQSKSIKIIYFTDPICSSCWGVEPQLRKLKLEYGNNIEIEYHMGGLLPDWSYNNGGISEPSDVARHWDEASLHYNMPIDGDLWLEDPLHSSYPPSIAFKAAQLQDEEKAILFLRKIREYVFLQKKNITKWEHIESAAKDVGLVISQLKEDFIGRANNLFYQDLELSKKMKVRGFPTFFIVNKEDEQEYIYGCRQYDDFERIIRKLAPESLKLQYDTSSTFLFDKFSTLTSKEYSELSGMERQKSESYLEKLCQQNVLERLVTKNGNLYFKKAE